MLVLSQRLSQKTSPQQLETAPLRRLTQKTSPQQALALSSRANLSSSQTARGLYDSLRIGRAAALSVIRRAYRLRALVVHPDKGGDADAFREAFAAFETLADVARRAEYDLQLESSGSQDGRGWSNEVPGIPVSQSFLQASDAAPAVNGEFATALRKSFAAIYKTAISEAGIHTFSVYELLILQGLLRKERPPWLLPPTADTKVEFRKGTRNFKSLTFFQRDGSYRVDVRFCNFLISTQTTRSLEQAIDWQIAIICMKDKALCRIRNTTEEVDPLIEPELFDALCDQPSMRLVFVSFADKSKKLHPVTSSLSLAMSLRRLTRSSNSFSQEEAAQQVGQCRKAFVDHCSKLLDMVDKRLVSQAQSLCTATDDNRANEVNARIASNLQLALKLDPESSRQATYKLNALPSEELDRRKGWLLAPAPCLCLPDEQMKPGASNASRGHQKNVVQRQSTSNNPGADECYRPRSQQPPFLFHKKSDWPSRWNTATLSPSMGLSKETYGHMLGFLTLRELNCINSVSIAMKIARCIEIWQRLRVFTFEEHQICPPKVSPLGRVVRPSDFQARLTSRLSGFLMKYAPAFEVLHLHAVPCGVLESTDVMELLSWMPHVSHVTFPEHGWSTPALRKNVLQSLRNGVRFDLVDGHGIAKCYGVR